MDKDTLKAEGISDDDLQQRLAYFKRYYQTKDIDTANGQARALGDNSFVSPHYPAVAVCNQAVWFRPLNVASLCGAFRLRTGS